jgi:hypothetical protein
MSTLFTEQGAIKSDGNYEEMRVRAKEVAGSSKEKQGTQEAGTWVVVFQKSKEPSLGRVKRNDWGYIQKLER